jgi:hypothetical protein
MIQRGTPNLIPYLLLLLLLIGGPSINVSAQTKKKATLLSLKQGEIVHRYKTVLDTLAKDPLFSKQENKEPSPILPTPQMIAVTPYESYIAEDTTLPKMGKIEKKAIPQKPNSNKNGKQVQKNNLRDKIREIWSGGVFETEAERSKVKSVKLLSVASIGSIFAQYIISFFISVLSMILTYAGASLVSYFIVPVFSITALLFLAPLVIGIIYFVYKKKLLPSSKAQISRWFDWFSIIGISYVALTLLLTIIVFVLVFVFYLLIFNI